MASHLTPADMDTTPAGVPPPGVVPNLANPPWDGYIFIIVGSIVMAIMYITAALRLYTKIYIRRRIGADDCKSFLNGFTTCCGGFGILNSELQIPLW